MVVYTYQHVLHLHRLAWLLVALTGHQTPSAGALEAFRPHCRLAGFPGVYIVELGLSSTKCSSAFLACFSAVRPASWYNDVHVSLR